MKNPKGYSLVELIVVIAILAIVGAAVLGFFVTSSRSYKNDSDETNLQYEAQLTVNQLENLIIDATTAISYTYSDGSSSSFITTNTQIPANAKASTLTVYNRVEKMDNTGHIVTSYEIYYITWKDTQLYLTKDTIDNNGTITRGKESIMAEYINEFNVSLEKAVEKNEVDLKLKFVSGNRVYNADRNIKLRNNFIINKKIEEVYPDLPSNIELVSRIDIYYNSSNYSAKTVSLFKKGNKEISMKFSASVLGVGNISKDVVWGVYGNTSKSTSMNSGTLKIATDEKADILTIRAVSKQDNSIAGIAYVAIKEITGISVNVASGLPVYKGTTAAIVANVTGKNLSEEDKQVTWSCTNAQPLDSVDSPNTKEFKITGSSYSKAVFTATSVADSSVSQSITLDIAKANYKIDLQVINSSDGTKNLLRNGNITFKADVISETGKRNEVKWKIKTVDGSLGSDMIGQSSTPDGFYLSSTSGETNVLNCGAKVPFTRAFTVHVLAYIEEDGEEVCSSEIAVSVLPVVIRFWKDNSSQYLDFTAGQDVTTNVAKDSANTFNYSIIQGFNSGALVSTSGSSNYVVETSANSNTVYAKVRWESAKGHGNTAKINLILNGVKFAVWKFNQQ